MTPTTTSGYGVASMLRSQSALRPQPLITISLGTVLAILHDLEDGLVAQAGAAADMDQQQEPVPEHPAAMPAIQPGRSMEHVAQYRVQVA